jgi:hypothetical protein
MRKRDTSMLLCLHRQLASSYILGNVQPSESKRLNIPLLLGDRTLVPLMGLYQRLYLCTSSIRCLVPTEVQVMGSVFLVIHRKLRRTREVESWRRAA